MRTVLIDVVLDQAIRLGGGVGDHVIQIRLSVYVPLYSFSVGTDEIGGAYLLDNDFVSF